MLQITGLERKDLLTNLDRIFSHDLPISKNWWLPHPYGDATPAPSPSYSYSFSYDYDEVEEQSYHDNGQNGLRTKLDLPVPKHWLHPYGDATPAPIPSYSYSFSYGYDGEEDDHSHPHHHDKGQIKIGDVPSSLADKKKYDPKASIVKFVERASFNKARQDQYLRGSLKANKGEKRD